MARLTDIQQIPLTAAFLDAAGNATAASGVTWASDSPIVTIVPGSSPEFCTAVAAGPLGTANVTCTAVNDAGQSISGSIALEVVASSATQVAVTAGDPAAK